ncbi:hypothetical protein AB0J14_07105 [Micromonospora arborensis]|uniref:hypothetical protein n=1 Tax=Micromonospora arborensis TaxID=2116518 RepID=UPI0033C59AB6
MPLLGCDLADPTAAPVLGHDLTDPTAIPLLGHDLTDPTAIPLLGHDLTDPTAAPAAAVHRKARPAVTRQPDSDSPGDTPTLTGGRLGNSVVRIRRRA